VWLTVNRHLLLLILHTMPMSQYTRCLVCLINCLQAARTSLQLIDGGGTWWAIYCSWAEPWRNFYRTSNSILSWQAINKQASKQRASKSGNQASKGVFCLLACLSASLIGSIVIPSDFASPTILNNRELVVFSLLRLWGLYLALGP